MAVPLAVSTQYTNVPDTQAPTTARAALVASLGAVARQKYDTQSSEVLVKQFGGLALPVLREATTLLGPLAKF